MNKERAWKIVLFLVAVAMIAVIYIAIFVPAKEDIPETETIETGSGVLGEPDTLAKDTTKAIE